MPTPIKSKIKIHFKKAKEVKCLKNDIVIDISTIRDFDFDKDNLTWTSVGGAVVFWKNDEFAEITKLKPNLKCKCHTCNCNEKKKTKKRKIKRII